LNPAFLYLAVEGDVDEAVLRRIFVEVGATPVAVYGKSGKDNLTQRLPAYNAAARFWPWVVVRDLNHDAQCAPELAAKILPNPSERMCFRVAVHEIEAWLMADNERIAQYLGIPRDEVPPNPDGDPNPKERVVALASGSRFRRIREEMTPRPGAGRVIGPAYNSRLIEFARSHWRPEFAAQNSPSLRKCLSRVRALTEGP